MREAKSEGVTPSIYSNYDKDIAYKKTYDALRQFNDVQSKRIKNLVTYNQEDLVRYLKDPSRYSTELINVSWYLYYRSIVYKRLISYYADMFCLQYRDVVPNYSLTKENKENKILKSYQTTIALLNKMNLQGEFNSVYKTCFIQDVYYGVAYFSDNGFYLQKLPEKYCKITAKYDDGSYAYKFNTSFFSGTNAKYLELWGEPFTSMMLEVEKNKKNRIANPEWVYVPAKYSVCLKYHTEDMETIIPPFAGLFSELSALEDLKNLKNATDAINAYKLIYYKIPLLSGAKNPDEWAVDEDLAVQYINRFVEDAIPPYISFGMVPGSDLGSISFEEENTTETNKIAKATEAVLNTAGGAEVLNGATITGAEAMRIAQRVNTEFALSSLLPQTEVIINRLFQFQLSNPSHIHFFPVSSYTYDYLKKDLLESCQYGFANKIAYNTLNDVSELDTMAKFSLENDILGMNEKMIPLNSSFTQSGDTDTDPVTGGRPTLDDTEISTDGEASRDKKDKAQG